MMYNSKDNQLDNLEARMGLNMPNSRDVLRREDFDSDDSYCTACAERDLAMETNPRLLELKRKYWIELEAQRQRELEEAEKKRYQEIRESVTLSAQERQDMDARALHAATADLREGRITPQKFNSCKAEHAKRLESAMLDEKATSQHFNEFLRAELSRNRLVAGAPQPQQDGK